MVKRKEKKEAAAELEVLAQIEPNAAGLDIGAEEIYGCVPAGRDSNGERVRVFATYTKELHRLADWLVACKVKTVAMESTGVYWIPVYDILEGRGIEVCLVNARHLKNVSGRKTDVADCEWLYQLHTYGLLRGSFHPPEAIRAIRALARHRDMLISYRSSHIQHMQKALDLMNLKLTVVLGDITGQTGMRIIRAILAGERNPKKLAAFRDPKCKHSEVEIGEALTGNYRREHLFSLRQAVELYDMYTRQMAAVDEEMEAMYAQLQPRLGQADESGSGGETTPPDPNKPAKRGSKNQPAYDLATALYRLAGVDLTQIDGINVLSAQTILTEVGLDMSKWPSDKHFASWLGLCPNNKITGGKVKRRHTRKTDNRAAAALRMAAQSLARSHCRLGAYYRSAKARHGAPVAVTATAHKLARIIYHMLKYQVDFDDASTADFEQRQQQRAVKRLHKQAAQLGFRLELASPAPS
jgi:transposase